ncbi:MAG: hypothetical protein ACRC7C_14365 [Beijerinckiaceae bacterium]
MTERLATGGCLRGLLPDDDGLTVGGVLTFATERHRDALCERGEAGALRGVIDDFNEIERENGPEAKR